MRAYKEQNRAPMHNNTIGSESKVCAMYKKSSITVGYAIRTAESEGKVCAMQQNSRIELGYAILIFESESKVWAMYKKKRIELGCIIVTVESVSKICAMQKKQNRARINSNDSGRFQKIFRKFLLLKAKLC